MDDEQRENIIRAAEKFSRKDHNEIKKLQGQGKKNKKPEKEVEYQCVKWMKLQGWDIDIYEAKNTRDAKGNFHASNMPAGVVDCMGITSHGEPVYVEFKAPGSRSTINQNFRQLQFLLRKINRFGFGCVVDSENRLAVTYKTWRHIHLNEGRFAARDFLLEQMPKKRGPKAP